MDDEFRFRIATGGGNWLNISFQIVLGLGNIRAPLPESNLSWAEGTSMEVVNPPSNWVALSTVRMVGQGDAEMAMTTPPTTAQMANDGSGPFDTAYDLRAVATFPHEDWIAFVANEDSGIESLEQIAEEELAVDLITTPPHRKPVENVAGFAVEEILKQYGLSYDLIESWGGSVEYGGRKQLGRNIDEMDFDLLIDEALMTPQWQTIANEADLQFLSLDERVLEFMSETYGYNAHTIPEGYLPDLDRDVPTLDFSSWVLVCRSDLPDEVVYSVVGALDERLDHIHEAFETQRYREEYKLPPLTSEIDLTEAWQDTGIPLHAGAEQYYEENGYK